MIYICKKENMYFINKIKRKKLKYLTKFKRFFYLLKNKKCNKLIIFFVPSEVDSISGGLLSICTIFNEVKKMKNIHGCDCYTSYLPQFNNNYYTYNQFENNLVLFNLKQIIKNYSKVKYLEIHIPEIFIELIYEENKNTVLFHNWLKTISKNNIKINILNQNDFYMITSGNINCLKNLTDNVTMTVAHEKYATLEKRIEYGIPLHLLSPWLTPTPYKFISFKNKENLILFSKDEIEETIYNTKIRSKDVVKHLKNILPNYEFKIIENIKYEDYKKLIGKAKFIITFGEGLDGYFVEPFFSGSISFAVFNEVFFNDSYKNLKTIYNSYEELIQNIENDIDYFNIESNYINTNNDVKNLLSKIYNIERLQNNLNLYFKGDYDFK